MRDAADRFDVVVVGAGPGGVAAAVTLAGAGRRVGLIDDAPFAGGQVWRNLGEPATDKHARRWQSRLAAAGDNLVRLPQSRVLARPSPELLLVETPPGRGFCNGTRWCWPSGPANCCCPFPVDAAGRGRGRRVASTA